MAYPTVHAGQHNVAVAALGTCLRRYLIHHDQAPANRANGQYGAGLIADVNRMKSLEGLKGGGKVFGTSAWQRLAAAGVIGKYDRMRIDKQLDLIAEARKARQQTIREIAHQVGARAAVAGAAVKFWETCRPSYVYGNFRPMPSGLYVPEAKTRLDCSSTAIDVYKDAGQEDPSGNGFNGYGDTGALWAHGSRVSAAQAGDLAFYGWELSPYPRPKHVAICISSAEVVSFGHTPIERYPLRYRSDFLGVRSYL